LLSLDSFTYLSRGKWRLFMSLTFSPRYNFFRFFFKFPTRLAFGVEQNIYRKWENHLSESKETSERRDDVSLWYIFSLSIPLWKVFLDWIQTLITIFPVLKRSHSSKVVGVELDLKIFLDDNLSSRPVSFFSKLINQTTMSHKFFYWLSDFSKETKLYWAQLKEKRWMHPKNLFALQG
jgi:hypothetical protein